MSASSNQSLAPRLMVLALAIALLLAGCGKSSLPSGRGEEGSGTIAFLGAAGAGGLVTSNTTRLGGADPVLDAAAVARAVHPGLTAATRPRAVVIVDEDNWPAALAASALAGPPLGAPLLYSEGERLPSVSADALQAMRPRGAAAVGGAQVIEIGTSAAPSGYRTRRLSSSDPFALAASVERLASDEHGGSAPRRVIVVGADGPRALAMPAAGLAAESGSPILFTSSHGIPAATRSLLARLGEPTIYAIGPRSAISESVLEELSRYGPVQRIDGATPAENAIAVARYTDGSFGWGVDEPGHGLAFANSSRPLDGPASASLSASGDYAPLLLLEGAEEIPLALKHYLSDIQPGYSSAPEYGPVRGVYNHGWLIGDEQAISTTIQGKLDSMLQTTQRNIPTTQPSVGP